MLNRLFLFFLILLSCKTSKNVSGKNSSRDIFGTWQYKESSGGFTGKGTAWQVPVTLNLTKEFIYELKMDQKIIETDQFKLTTKSHGEDSIRIMDLNNGIDKHYRLSGDTLFLDELVNDGYSYVFLRKK